MYNFFRIIGTYSHSLPLRENGTQFVYNSKMQQICHLGDGVNNNPETHRPPDKGGEVINNENIFSQVVTLVHCRTRNR